MPAAYDKFNYPSYWKGREYEHQCEVIALKDLLEKIPKVEAILDVGAGYGRLTPYYLHRGKRIVLSDPSAKHLKMARKAFESKKFRFIQAKAENLKTQIKKGKFDLALSIRVLHHIDDLGMFLKVINWALAPKGYFLFEFPNKRHFKALFSNFFKGDITFAFDIFPKEIGKKKEILPFKNYHPDNIYKLLDENGFEVVEKRSVSNIRSSFIKSLIHRDNLLGLEKKLQKPLSAINFGPSIFVLARKRG